MVLLLSYKRRVIMDILNIIKYEYGMNTKDAKNYLKNINNKTKEELKRGYYNNMKKSFYTD